MSKDVDGQPFSVLLESYLSHREMRSFMGRHRQWDAVRRACERVAHKDPQMPITQDQLDAWKRLALDVRERMHLQYARGECQLVPLEMLIAVRFALPSLAEEVERLREALRRIGCAEAFTVTRALDKERDNELIARMEFARLALDETTTPLTTTPEG